MCSDITAVSLPVHADIILSEFNRVKLVFILDEQELQLQSFRIPIIVLWVNVFSINSACGTKVLCMLPGTKVLVATLCCLYNRVDKELPLIPLYLQFVTFLNVSFKLQVVTLTVSQALNFS